MYHHLICLFLLASSGVAIAEGNPVVGKDKALICTGCHGSDGNNDNSEYPILAGQKKSYLLKQLKDFKSGERVDDHMSSMVLAVEESDFEDIIAYFSSHKIVNNSKNTPSNKPGKNIFNKGIKSKEIPACASCHGEDAAGNEKQTYPSLALQHKEYLIKALKDFHGAKRSNDKGEVMRNIASKLNSTEIEAIADYLSKLDH